MSNSDLVRRAREMGGFSPEAELCSLMADEIERLRAALWEIMVLSNKRSPHPMSAEADYFRIAHAVLEEKE